MGQKINIPSQNQPFRKQSSLGGDVSFRNLNGTNDNSFITLAKVTKVYYKQGKLDFKLTNTVSIVQEQGGDGSGSAPIPVDFFGRKPDGQVFGHYRPVKVGDLIAIAYINGHRSNPIVIGVYPDSAPDYELISPSMFDTGDDNDSGIAETGLAEQKVYPSMQTSYRSGSGTIAEALNGHSFLILDDETANQYDQLWTDYESVGFFNHNGETTNPLKEEAGSWLLVHEDNPDGDGDGHRTRFYVNPKGEIQIVLMGSDSEGDVSVLEGSRKDGFTLKHYNDLSSIKAGDKGQDVYNPDFDVAKKYVELNIGKDQSILMQAVDQGFSGGNTSLTVKSDGVYLNDKPLNASITDSVREHSKEVADAISKDLTTTKEWEDFDKRVTQAGKDAKDAGDKAKQAGEDAKQAGISAEKAGEDAKKTGEDIKRHIVYYASAFPQGDHYIPGKYLAINTETYIANGIIKSAMIEDGAIDNAKIAYEAVGSSQIEDLAVTRGKLAYMAVGTAQIEDLAVSDEKVDHLSFNHMEGELLDAHKIRVRNLSGDSISAKTLTADKLIIGELGDITDKLGTIADGKIIVKGNGKNSGVDIEGLDADNPDVYTPSKKAALANIVHAIESSALASLDYAKQVGLSNDPVAIDLQNKYNAMVDGLAPIFQHMDVSTKFDHNTVEQLTSDCNNAIDKFQNLANSQLNRKIGQTADNKNSVYQGYEQPANPHINDIWFQENSDGTYQIRVYDGGSWISPGMQDIKEVQESMQNLPRNYYQASAPTGNISAGSTWYKLERGSDGNYTYTPYKWENKQWVKMLSSDQVVDFHNIQNLQKDLKKVNGTLVELNNQVIADKRNIQADYNGKIEGINRVVNTNKETTDKALNDNLNIAKGYADDKASGALANAQQYADGKASSALANAQQYADGKANSALANAQTYANDRANGALASATKYVDTQLKISKEGLESQILGTGGGVNLALTSDSDWSVPASGAYIGDSNKCIELSRYVLDGDNFSKGDTITYSVHLSFSGIKGNNPTMTLQSVLSNNDWSHAIYPNCNINAITQNSNYEVTLKGTATLDPFPTALGTYILQIRFDRITAGTVKFCKVKIEKGSVATPYVASDTSYRSLIKATDSKLEGAVMKGTDYAGMVITPEHGFTAVANNMNFTLNKTAGFVINNKSDNIFKVDPSGNLTMKGDLVAGNISGVKFTGKDLTLNNSLQVVNGNISANNGNVVINSNGLTIKDGGLNIVNSKGETTTMIRDDGTFATNKGYFSGEVHTTKLSLSGNDSDINMGGLFHVDSHGNVTATSISITGNRKDDVSNQALIKGANITDGNIIKGNLIEGNDIIGNRIQSSEFMTSTREYSNGSYYPISGSIYTPSFLIEDSGNISVHTVFPQAFSTVARIGSNKGVDGPYVNITHEAFDRSTLSGSFGYGRGYEYPVPYLYGHQGGMVEYPVNSNELSIVYMNDISRSEYNGYGLYDGYKYTEIATINDIVQKYKSKIGRIKFNFGIVCTYGSYDTSGGTTTAGGYHDLYVVLTTGRINENDTYHVDFDGKTFNNVRNNIKIKMTSKKVLTGVGGLSYYNLYAELSTKDLDLANTYYLGVLQKGFIKDSRESIANHTWKIQIDEMAIIPEGDILDDQGYYVPTAGGSYRDLTISANGSIVTHEDDIGVQTTSEYNSRYLSFAVSTDGQSPMPYWTTINADGIGFSIGNNNSSTDGSGNPNGLATRQCIYFSGDSNQNGMSMDNYGNVHAQVGAGIWRIYNNQGDEVFNVPFDPNGVFNFYVPRVNKNIDPNHKWGGLKIGWVYFDQPGYRWAETVPAIYNTGGRVKGFAMFGDFIISFVDGWCYQLSSWGRNGVPNGVDSSRGEAEGTNTDAGHRGV